VYTKDRYEKEKNINGWDRKRIREKKSTPMNFSTLSPSHSILSIPPHPFSLLFKSFKTPE
jgi:hypothetical protein